MNLLHGNYAILVLSNNGISEFSLLGSIPQINLYVSISIKFTIMTINDLLSTPNDFEYFRLSKMQQYKQVTIMLPRKDTNGCHVSDIECYLAVVPDKNTTDKIKHQDNYNEILTVFKSIIVVFIKTSVSRSLFS